MYKTLVKLTLSPLCYNRIPLTTVSKGDISLIMLHPSTISSLKYALYAFYHLFALCAGIRMLMEDDDSPAVAMPIPSRVAATSHPKVKPRTKRSKLDRYHHNASILSMLRNDANGGNSTS